MIHVIIRLRYPIKLNIHYACKSKSSIIKNDFYSWYSCQSRNGLQYYRAQQVKIPTKDLYWKRSPEDYCQGLITNYLLPTHTSFFLDTTTTVNYTTQFLGVQYFVDLAIIQYVTGNTPSISSVSSFSI